MGVEELALRLGVSEAGGELPGLPGVTRLPGPDSAVVLLADTAAGAAWARQRTAVLSAPELERAARFVVPGLGQTWAAAHVLVREVLGRATRTPADQVRVWPGEHGKPLTGEVEFSLSHTGTLVLIGLGGLPLGVDVEALPSEHTATQVGGCLHPRETAELLALAPDRRPEAFARLWVRKEAMLKAIGTGLLRDVAADYVGTGEDPATPIAGWRIHDIALPGDSAHRAALCVSVPG
ncbi:MAG: 4'-phosphopantetheinyl transferase superfamily protein [Propionibacteriaceae bacterium]|nr:4'-phosphopantetheinyl transferase superfamily protein [Propionibacteriaceae bacterium]